MRSRVERVILRDLGSGAARVRFKPTSGDLNIHVQCCSVQSMDDSNPSRVWLEDQIGMSSEGERIERKTRSSQSDRRDPG